MSSNTPNFCRQTTRIFRPAARAPHPNAPSDLPPLEMQEEPSAARPKAHLPCPHCGTRYEAGVVICIACGLNLLTGQPVGAGPSREPFHSRRPVAREDVDIDAIGFWRMTAGVILKPLQTMEYFSSLFARPEMLAKAVAFYAVSFVAVAIAAAFAAHPDHNAELQAAIAEVERVHTFEAHVPEDWVDVNGPAQGLTEWGQPFAYKVLEPHGQLEAGKPFTFRILVTEPGRTKGATGKAKIGRTPSFGNATGDEWYAVKPGTADGEYVAEIPAARDGGTSFAFFITCRADTQAGKVGCQRCTLHFSWTHLPGWGKLVLEDRQARLLDAARVKGLPVPGESSSGGGVMSAALGSAGIVAALAFNVFSLLLSAAIFTGAARLLGGGGAFSLMLVTMAYLTGFANFFQFFVLFTPLKLHLWLQVVLLVYGFGLQLFALMKVYDIDVLQALFTTVLAWSAKLLGAAYLVMMVLKMVGRA